MEAEWPLGLGPFISIYRCAVCALVPEGLELGLDSGLGL